MGSILLKTLIMFLLSFVIAMFVAVLIYWIRSLLTSVRVNSFFDEKSKKVIRRALRIHKLHDQVLSGISEKVEHDLHPELFDFYRGVNEEYRQPEENDEILKPIIRRKKVIKKHKNL
jgi:nitrogen fixation/metabolism regulation signal transduction histidine kinase